MENQLGKEYALEHHYYLNGDTEKLPVCIVGVKYGKEGKKIVRPLLHEDGEWIKGKPEIELPLYNLHQVKKHIKKPIIVVEGEKTADAGTKQFGNRFIFVTSIGGSSSAAKTDWAPILARDVLIIPDNDTAGISYATSVVKILLDGGGYTFDLVDTTGFPDKWDIADAWPVGLPTFDQLISKALNGSIGVKAKLRQDQAANAFIFSKIISSNTYGMTFLNKQWFKFNGRNYEVVPCEVIFNDVSDFLTRAGHQVFCSTGFIQNVVAQIRAKLARTEASTKFWLRGNDETDPKKILTLHSGLHRIRTSGDVQLISKHTPNFFDTSFVNLKFMPEAKCPRWENYIKSCLPDEADRTLLQDWFGYHFTHTIQLRKYMTFYGTGRNGKSIVCNMLRILVGRENCSSVDLTAFSKEFHLAETYGKIANISDELPTNIGRLNDGDMKKFMAGENFFFNPKGVKGWTARATAKWTQAANRHALAKDNSHGLFDRTQIINFERRISVEEADPKFTDDSYWEPELSGVFNWAMVGLVRICAQGKLTLAPKHRNHVQMLRDEATPELTWLNENYRTSNGIVQGSSTMYKSYIAAMHEQGLKHDISAPRFVSAIRNVFPDAEYVNSIRVIDGIRQRYWRGISSTESNRHE